MTSTKCKCGHEKSDHRAPVLGKHAYGACKVCLCNQYIKPSVPEIATGPK